MLSSGASPARAQWTGGGPDLAWVTTLLRPLGDAGPVLAGTYGGGVWRSDDLGQSWVDISGPRVAGSVIWSLAYRDFGGEDQIYVGTEFDGLWRARSFGGPVSDDLNQGLNAHGLLGIRGIAIHPHNPQVVSVATTSGIWTSNTGGLSWPDSLRWLPNFTCEDIVVSPLAPITIFALDSFTLFRSPDKGNTFFDLGAGLPGSMTFDLALWPNTLDEFYVVTLNSGVYRSAAGQPFAAISPAVGTMRNYVIEIDASGDRLYLGSERGLFRSDDRGANWQQHNGRSNLTPLPEIWSALLLESEPPSLLLGSFRYGVLATGADLAQWVPRNDGLRAAWVEALDAWPGGILAGTAHGQIFLSEDAGQSWIDVTGDLDAIRPRDIVRLPSGRWLLTGPRGHWLSDDAGEHWRQPSTPPSTNLGHRFLRVADTLYMGTRAGVWQSTDQGENWQRIDAGLPVDDYFALAAAADGSLAFGAFGDAIYLRRPGESSFAPVRTGAFLSKSYRDLVFRDADSNLLFVAADTQLKLWRIEPDLRAAVRQNLESGLPFDPGQLGPGGPGPMVERLHWDASRGLIAALYERGVYRAPDPGRGWEAIDAGIRVPRVEDLAYVAQEDRLIVATIGSGVWSAPLGALTGFARSLPPIAASLRLTTNPVREVAQLEIELSASGNVELSLFDLRGRHVADIHRGAFGAGKHRLQWEPRDARGRSLAAGQYFVRGRLGGREQTQRLSIVR
jgi:photosystem II stability/assembly factor-like uncharacterized protein